MAQTRPVPHTVRLPTFLLGVAVVLFLVLTIGGYGLHWRWTGLSSQVTLWDWLQALALPVALGAVPVLLRHRQRLSRRHRHSVLAIVAGFALLTVVGYVVPLGWTGFSGNTLWDWLELLVLPAAVSSASLWVGLRPRRRHLALLTLGSTAFVLLVICGYLVPWRWTGFSGNTLWDWVKLLLVPVLIPTVLVPTVVARLDDRLAAAAAARTRRIP